MFKSHLKADVQRHLVAGHEGGRKFFGQGLLDGFFLDDPAHADQGAEYTDIQNHRIADLLNNGLVKRQLHLPGINLAGCLDKFGVGYQ